MTNGILIINKPKNYTSRDIVNIVSKKLKTKQIGHTGTLDPLATGVLVLTIGTATKISELITQEKKEYIATMTFGMKTDTLDITGNIINNEDSIISKEEILNCLNSFKKTYEQEVPIYSAVKVNGKKLYEYARNNEEVILPKKKVTIHEIELLDYNIIDNKTVVKFKCLVSKGTYIRSLINDIASNLNKFAVMSDLQRTKQGNYKIEDSLNVDSEYKIIPIEIVLNNFKIINLDKNLEKKIINGVVIDNIYNEEYILFKNENNLFLYKDENNKLKPYKMFL